MSDNGAPAMGMGNVSVEDFRRSVLSRPPLHVDAAGYRRAAVLVPLLPEEGRWHVLFTRRSDALDRHGGQVSFPGGAAEKGESPYMTALREAGEEIGLLPGDVEILGELDELCTPTGYVITPVVGVLRQGVPLTPSRNEVARLFTVPLDFFADEHNAASETRIVDGRPREVWFYRTDGETIWGATALIIRGMLERLRASPAVDGST
ncbi:MAG: CoA pyrophosphatase [Bacteroidota bacterium]|nr:CoA pyrophosphatase [Bacteroidota bacterium]